MVDGKVRVPGPNGQIVDGVEVLVEESSERWSDFLLKDGTKLRIKVSLAAAIRLDGVYDPQGNPMYMVNAIPVMAIIHTPEELRKKETE
jgi:hypothetical protein